MKSHCSVACLAMRRNSSLDAVATPPASISSNRPLIPEIASDIDCTSLSLIPPHVLSASCSYIPGCLPVGPRASPLLNHQWSTSSVTVLTHSRSRSHIVPAPWPCSGSRNGGVWWSAMMAVIVGMSGHMSRCDVDFFFDVLVAAMLGGRREETHVVACWRSQASECDGEEWIAGRSVIWRENEVLWWMDMRGGKSKLYRLTRHDKACLAWHRILDAGVIQVSCGCWFYWKPLTKSTNTGKHRPTMAAVFQHLMTWDIWWPPTVKGFWFLNKTLLRLSRASTIGSPTHEQVCVCWGMRTNSLPKWRRKWGGRGLLTPRNLR